MVGDSSTECRIITEAAPPWRVLQVNALWCSVSGYPEVRWLGNTCRMMQGPETCQQTTKVLNDALRAQRPINVRLINYRADLTPFVNDLSVVPMPENCSPGAATHFVGIMREHPLFGAVPRALVAPTSSATPTLPSNPLVGSLMPSQLNVQMALQEKTLQILQTQAAPVQLQMQSRSLLTSLPTGLDAAKCDASTCCTGCAPTVRLVTSATEPVGCSGGAVEVPPTAPVPIPAPMPIPAPVPAVVAAGGAAPRTIAPSTASQDARTAAAQLAAAAAASWGTSTSETAGAGSAPYVGENGGGENGSGSVRVPPFLTKLYTIVEQPQREDYVGWCDDGASFRVLDPTKFAARVLPRYFKHNKLGSFQQQLLTYGFQRIPNESCLDISSVWTHPYFRRGHHHLLELIVRAPSRKPAVSSSSSQSQSGSVASEEPHDIHQMQAQLGSLSHSLHLLHEELRTARLIEMQALDALAERVCKRKRTGEGVAADADVGGSPGAAPPSPKASDPVTNEGAVGGTDQAEGVSSDADVGSDVRAGVVGDANSAGGAAVVCGEGFGTNGVPKPKADAAEVMCVNGDADGGGGADGEGCAAPMSSCEGGNGADREMGADDACPGPTDTDGAAEGS